RPRRVRAGTALALRNRRSRGAVAPARAATSILTSDGSPMPRSAGHRLVVEARRCPLRRVANEKDLVRIPHAIVPPHIFAHMANLSDVPWTGLADRGRASRVFGRGLPSAPLPVR